MRKLNNAERKKMAIYIKNKIDISVLIKDVNLSSENLSNAIISDLTISNQVIKNTNFSNAVIGTKEKIAIISGSVLTNCNFKAVKFPHAVYFRRNKCKNCNFDGAFMPYVSYQYTEFDSACTFCATVFRLGSREGLGATFSDNFFRELSKFWGVEIVGKKK